MNCHVTGKYCFAKKSARGACNQHKKRGVIVRPYHCQFCNLWHITKQVLFNKNTWHQRGKLVNAVEEEES